MSKQNINYKLVNFINLSGIHNHSLEFILDAGKSHGFDNVLHFN